MDDLDLQFFLHLGYFPRYEEKVVLDYSGIDRSRYEGASRAELLEQGAQVLKETIAGGFESGNRHIVPISGGLDSRAILAALMECTNAANIDTYTFGTPGTYDYDLGCKVAEWAGTNHTAIPLDDYEWSEDDFVQAAERFEYQTFLFHHAPIKLLDQFADGITWSGYIGDAVSGGHLKPQPAETLEEGRKRYLKKRAEVKSISFITRPIEDFAPLIGGGKFEPHFLTYDEQVLFDEVGSITAPHVLMTGFDYKTPMINSPFWNFYMSIPDGFRKNQNLFIEVMLREYPDLFGLPSKTSYGLKLSSSDLQKFVRRGRNKLWNIARQNIRAVDWPALPMTNFFDADLLLRNNETLSRIVRHNLENLQKRNVVPWIDIDALWNAHINRKAHHGDALKILFSLEMNLKGREAQKAGAAA